MPAVYQQTWIGCCNGLICKEFTCEEKSYGTCELLTKTVDDAPVNFLYYLGAFAKEGFLNLLLNLMRVLGVLQDGYAVMMKA